MASAWGNSWGTSWLDSWAAATPLILTPPLFIVLESGETSIRLDAGETRAVLESGETSN